VNGLVEFLNRLETVFGSRLQHTMPNNDAAFMVKFDYCGNRMLLPRKNSFVERGKKNRVATLT
jgi:hypothetical protein